MGYDEVLANRLRERLLAFPGVTEKRMFGGLAFLLDGNMAIAASGRGGLMVRARAEEATDLIAEEAGAEAMVMRGREMREWLRVEANADIGEAELERWIAVGVRAARVQPPKA